jgi:N-formylglutamate amidohydrolase
MNDYGFVVVHIPHASTHIPSAYTDGIVLSRERLQEEIILVTDSYCDELFSVESFGAKVVAQYSRLACDVERFRDDMSEPESVVGHGLLYTHTQNGEFLRANNLLLRDKAIAEIYDPHHEKLTECVELALRAYGKCLIIDCHSFSAEAKGIPEEKTPDVCIGADEFHTPEFMVESVCCRRKIQRCCELPLFRNHNANGALP